MKTIEAIIEKAKDGTYSVYCVKEIFSGTGNTIEEAKDNMREQMIFYKKTAQEEGFRYPAFLDEGYEISYAIDGISLMRYYIDGGVLTYAGLGKLTGINQKQLWSYMNGTKPRKAQKDKLLKGFQVLQRELNGIFA